MDQRYPRPRAPKQTQKEAEATDSNGDKHGGRVYGGYHDAETKSRKRKNKQTRTISRKSGTNIAATNKYSVGSSIISSDHDTKNRNLYGYGKPGEARIATNKFSPPLDLSRHFSVASNILVGSDVKKFYKYFAIHKLIGDNTKQRAFPMPPISHMLPSRSQSLRCRPGWGEFLTNPYLVSQAYHPKESTSTTPEKRIDITTALQYGIVAGYPPLLSFIRQFKSDWIRESDCMLCEEFVYMNAIQTVTPRGVNVVTVAMDSDGMMVRDQDEGKEVCGYSQELGFKSGKETAFDVYGDVSFSSQRTGVFTKEPNRRRPPRPMTTRDLRPLRKIRRHRRHRRRPTLTLQYPSAADALEDHFRSVTNDTTNINGHNYIAHGTSYGYLFLDSLVPTYLSRGTDGHVVRLNIFPKSIAPGCRLAWLTAQPELMECIGLIAEMST
ncbi:hypothetical protein GX48_01019 [Paracoccidioides brasiliensis]|nr:hypothetical protein GX48_01019 [Paracoccidioides brasiliensis]